MSKVSEMFIKNYDQNSDIGYIFEADAEYYKGLHNLHNDLPFFPERMKIKKGNKLVCNLYDKDNYVAHITTLKQALNHRLILKKVDKVTQFNQNEWPKLYFDMNTKLKTEAENNFEKDFLKLMHNAVFGKIMKNVRKHGDIKLAATNKRRNYLVSEPNYHMKKWFSETLLSIGMKKINILRFINTRNY